MVSRRLAAACRAAAATAALTLAAACGSDREPASADADGARALAERVRARYGAPDAIAAGAWTWSAPDGTSYVLVDVQSAVEGLVQARLDLWMATDTSVTVLGRSDVMPSAAEIGAFAVDDLSGDGLPDLFGWVADSSGVRYPIYLPGARGGLIDALALAAPGWRFETEDPLEPGVVAGVAGACALKLWAEPPAPDRRPSGWRWLLVLRDGLAAPAAEEPVCP